MKRISTGGGRGVSAFLSLPPESAKHLETHLKAKTLFYGKLGSNIVWGFLPADGAPGVAVTDGTGQIVVNIDNLRELVRMMEAAP